MLSVSTYSAEHIAACRARIDRQLDSWVAVRDAAAGAPGGAEAVAAFAPEHFNAMVLALDRGFVHRARGGEGKDGNPLNEVRILCDGIAEHDGIVGPAKPIKLDPAKTVLGHAEGDRIALSEDDFRRLADAFFAEIGKRFA